MNILNTSCHNVNDYNCLISKLSYLFGEIIVAVHPGGHFSSFDGFMAISHKLCNLLVLRSTTKDEKVAAT